MFQVVYDTIRVYFFDPHSIPVECELESLYEESLWFLNALQGDLPQPGKGNLSMDDRRPWDDLLSCCVCHHWASKGISTLSCTLNLKRIVGYRNPGWKEKKNWLEATERGSGAASTKKSVSLLFFPSGERHRPQYSTTRFVTPRASIRRHLHIAQMAPRETKHAQLSSPIPRRIVA